MFARLFSLGVVLGLSGLVALGLFPLSAAQAAYPGWSVYAAQHKSLQFRPWARADTGPAGIQRQTRIRAATPRPASRTPARSSAFSNGRQRQQPLFSDRRAGARKAVPVTRGQELGLRFRPDDRQSPYGQSPEPQGEGATNTISDELQSQFRPGARKRKPTYEELQAESAPWQPQMVPAMPYPMLPQPLPPYPGRYPRW